MSPLMITILICVITFALFLSGKFPLGACGMFCALALLLTGVLDASQAFAGFANTNVVIMVSMMIVSAGLMKTSLVGHIMKLVDKVGGGNERGIIIGFGLILIILTQFVNGFVAIACMIPFINGMCDDAKVSPSKVYFPLMVIALAWITLFPLASGLNIIAMMNGYLEMYASDWTVGMWDMAIARLPGTLLTTVFAVLVLPKFCPASPTVNIKKDLGKELAKGNLSAGKEKLSYVIAIGTVGLMLTNSLHHIPLHTVAAAGAFLMVLTGVLSEKECFDSIGWGTVFMFAGILPLATALEVTGANAIISDLIVSLLGGTTNPWIISAVFALIAWALTQVMSNSAVAVVFMSLTAMICVNLNMNPVGILNLVYLAATAGFMSPMAAAGVPLAMGAGGYDLKDCIKLGLFPSLILVGTSIVWCSIVFPAYGA